MRLSGLSLVCRLRNVRPLDYKCVIIPLPVIPPNTDSKEQVVLILDRRKEVYEHNYTSCPDLTSCQHCVRKVVVSERREGEGTGLCLTGG